MTPAFQINSSDNVATMLSDAEAGDLVGIRGETDLSELSLLEPIHEGHKVAMLHIAAGDTVVKYGTSIGTATKDVSPGEWVHLHNCRSNYDARSSTLDVVTGASSDVRYE